MPDLLVVGDLVTDILVATGRPVEPGSDTAGRVRTTGGGQAGNTAAWLVACGSAATLVAVVGDDAAGRDRVAELVAAGVSCAVSPRAGARTGTVVVLSAAGERSMVTDRGAADQLSVADVDAGFAAAPNASHLHLSGYVLLAPATRAAGRHALRGARARGWTTSVDAASVGPLRTAGPAAFLDWVHGVDLLLANADEAALLGVPEMLTAAGAVAGGPVAGRPVAGRAVAGGAVVVKLGPAGARWHTSSGALAVPATATEAVDATGAGDAFAAGLLTAWLSGADPEACLSAAARAGAAAIRRLGAR